MRAFRRQPAARHAADFAHHAAGIARLNHGSFGGAPKPVIEAESAHRAWWRANPDGAYFAHGDSSLDARLAAASDAAAAALCAPTSSVALVENATVATAIIGNRWAQALRERPAGGGVLLLDVCYKAVAYSLRAYLQPAGGHLHYAHVPFPDTTSELVLRHLDEALATARPRFAMLDHVSSQPALVLPINEMVALCRHHGVEEVAIDCSHTVHELPLRALFSLTACALWCGAGGHRRCTRIRAAARAACAFARRRLLLYQPTQVGDGSRTGRSNVYKRSRQAEHLTYRPIVASWRGARHRGTLAR
jgi:selenocysteine lyase/cysteine desulfurase